jgi:lipopolysaccharide export system permease protein
VKILDKYIAKNFLVGYIIAFAVLIGLRMMIDLFVNIDEFTEKTDASAFEIIGDIATFYGVQSTIYFRDFAGIITVVAAVFSLSKMTRFNELTAVMASGVSLKRVIMPIIVMSLLLSGLLVIDQEILIPRLATRIVRDQDEVQQSKTYTIECLTDSSGSIIYAARYDETVETMTNPTIILREPVDESRWKTTGWIRADTAVFDREEGVWRLQSQTTTPQGETETTGGIIREFSRDSDTSLVTGRRSVVSYKSSLTPELIPIRRQEKFTSLLSVKQLEALAAGGYVQDRAKLYMQKHSRFTDPIINFIMLMVALPILVCRDNKAMKPAIMTSFVTTGACFIAMFASKMLATEQIFGFIRPELWVFLPIVIFLPIAVLEIDAIKT